MNIFAPCTGLEDISDKPFTSLCIFNRALGSIYPSCLLVFPANTVYAWKTCRLWYQFRGVRGRTKMDQCVHTHRVINAVWCSFVFPVLPASWVVDALWQKDFGLHKHSLWIFHHLGVFFVLFFQNTWRKKSSVTHDWEKRMLGNRHEGLSAFTLRFWLGRGRSGRLCSVSVTWTQINGRRWMEDWDSASNMHFNLKLNTNVFLLKCGPNNVS